MRWETYLIAAMLATLIIGAEAAYATRDGRRGRRPALVTMFGIAAFPVAVLLHNVASPLLDGEETVSFIVGVLMAPAAITLGTLGVAVAIRRTHRIAAAGFAAFGAGLSALPLYVIALFVSAAVDRPIAAEGVVASALLPSSLAVITGGVILAAFGLAAEDAARIDPATA